MSLYLSQSPEENGGRLPLPPSSSPGQSGGISLEDQVGGGGEREVWRENAQSWNEIFKYLYQDGVNVEDEDEDNKFESLSPKSPPSPSSKCLAHDKDISFQVGDRIIQAHSFVLQMKSGLLSRVIGKLFTQALTGEGHYISEDGNMMWELKPIKVTITDPSSFKILLKFMYTEEIDGEKLSDDQLVRVVDAALKFEVNMMVSRCKILLEERLHSGGNVISIYITAERLGNVELMEKCFDILKMSGPELFESADFIKISPQLLCKLLESDELNAPETIIFYGVISWAREKMNRLGMFETGPAFRTVLNPAHHLIRYTLLSSEFLIKEVQPLGILEDSEMLEVSLFYLSQNKDGLVHFCPRPRRFQKELSAMCSQSSQQSMSNEEKQTENIFVGAQAQAAIYEALRTNTPPSEEDQSQKSITKALSPPPPLPFSFPFRISSDNAHFIQAPAGVASTAPKRPFSVQHELITSSESEIEQEEGEVFTPAASPMPTFRRKSCETLSSDSDISSNQNTPLSDITATTSTTTIAAEPIRENSHNNVENIPATPSQKRRLSSDSVSSASKRSTNDGPQQAQANPLPVRPRGEGYDRVLTLSSTLDKVLHSDDVRFRINRGLEKQQIESLERVAKIILYNIILPKRRNANPSIILPNLRHLEIIFDSSKSKTRSLIFHPDDYLIFGTQNEEVLLDSHLWDGLLKISLWENGIRRFEINPVDHSLFLNMEDDPKTASHILRRLAVDIPRRHCVKRLALSCTTVQAKLNAAHLTHLVLHRCDLENSDIFRECLSLEKLSWVGIFATSVMDLSHLSNSASTLTNLSLCNVTIKVNNKVPILTSLDTMNIIMCKWEDSFEEKLGVVFPYIRKLFFTTYHNFVPSDAMTKAIVSQMKCVESVLICYATPYVLKCVTRVKEGARFLKFLKANATLTNNNVASLNIPRMGFRLRRRDRNWSFLSLPLELPTETLSLVQKEYFDYFLLQVFSRDAAAFFRETTLVCKHSNCMGRYFQQSNFIQLSIHEQELHAIKNGLDCCGGNSSGDGRDGVGSDMIVIVM